MNSIGNSIFIHQNAPAVSAAISGSLHMASSQSVVLSQVLADKQDLIKRAKKIEKSKSIDPEIEHKKETSREYHLSTQEYEKIFLHIDSLPVSYKQEKLQEIKKEFISHYEDVNDSANEHHHMSDIKA